MKEYLTGYIGTYTKQESQGVYKFTLDTKKELITDVKPVAKLDNPTYVTVSQSNDNLYAVSKEGENGGVTAFAIHPTTHELEPLNSLAQPGSPPCHVSVKSDNSHVLTANYHTKKIESYLTHSDGSLKSLVDTQEHEGSGPHERQEKPHLHFAGFTPDEKFAVAIDLGSDEITTYKVEENGLLTKANVFATEPGSGPRHLVFSSSGEYAYVMTELSSEVLTLTFDSETGVFTQKQKINAIPSDFNEVNDGSAIHITKDDKFVYVANRGHNSIALFSIDQSTHELSFVEWKSTEGDWPRDFVLDPSERYLVAANQKSNSLTLYRRDQETGRLTTLQTDIKAPEAVCVKFLNQ